MYCDIISDALISDQTAQKPPSGSPFTPIRQSPVSMPSGRVSASSFRSPPHFPKSIRKREGRVAFAFAERFQGGKTMRQTSEWRCQRCGKMLGSESGGRLHIRISRGREYRVELPAQANCAGCGTLNELSVQLPAMAGAQR